MATIEVEELTIAQVHAAYKAGTYTCRQLVEAYLHRIQSLDREGPNLNSILAVSDFALSEADALDSKLKSNSQLSGPLHGIPVIVKDQAQTKGITTTFGSIIAKDHVPNQDATIVTKLKDAGAIILAKSTMPDWATNWWSTSSLSGLTKNPYALDRDVGGSSSGTGAAIAANLGLIGIGEDTGGSIRLPSSFCNLVGLRSTPGLISRAGMSPLIKTQDTPGPMTRTVTDAAIMLDSLVGFDVLDPWTSTAVIAGPPIGGSYTSQLNPGTISKARIGILRSQFGSSSNPAYASVNEVINSTLSALAATGTTFIDIEVPNLEHYVSFTPTYVSRSRDDLDGYLASTDPPLTTNMAEIYSQNAYHPNCDLLIDICTGPAKPADDPDYLERLTQRDDFQNLVIGIMASNDIEAIAFPDAKMPAPKHEDVAKWSAMEFPTNTLFASQLRMPAVTVPAGFTTEGLPVGLELVGLPYAEQGLLGLAYGVEQVVKGRRAPKL